MGRNLKTFFISGSSGSRITFAKIWQEELTSHLGKSINSIYTAPTAKMQERHMISLIQSITRCDKSDDIDATSLIPGVL